MIHKVKATVRGSAASSGLGKSFYRSLNRSKMAVTRALKDEHFARLKFYENTGRHLNLKNPVQFNEKLWWLKLNNRDPRLTACSDKGAVRDYVRALGHGETLQPIIGIYDSIEDIPFDALPDRAFMKLTHTSGVNYRWERSAGSSPQKVKMRFRSAMRSNYYWQSREWNYKNITPRILVEEFIDDPFLVDFRFLCFHGKCQLVFADIGTAASDGSHAPDAKRNVYDREFNWISARAKRENFDPSLIARPENWADMVALAESLAGTFPFVRVDLYNLSGVLRFGEMTFYPGGATQIIEPESLETEAGSWIDLASPMVVRS